MTPTKTKALANCGRKGLQTNLPKTTGKFEMNPTSKTKPNANALPSLQQVIRLVIVKAEHDLQHLMEIRCQDESWEDDDVDIDNASKLALWKIQSMKTMNFDSQDDFCESWYKVSAVINLVKKGFTRQDCWYARSLERTCRFFEQAPGIVEFADAQNDLWVAESALVRNDEALMAA